MKTNLLTTTSYLDEADILIIPCVKGEQKSVEKFLQSHKNEKWAKTAMDILHHRKSEPKKNLEQYIESKRIILVGLDADYTYIQNANAVRCVLLQNILWVVA